MTRQGNFLVATWFGVVSLFVLIAALVNAVVKVVRLDGLVSFLGAFVVCVATAVAASVYITANIVYVKPFSTSQATTFAVLLTMFFLLEVVAWWLAWMMGNVS
jgi:hypothetical protein